MASQRQCLVAMASTAMQATTRPRPHMALAAASSIPRFLLPSLSMSVQQTRHASQKNNKQPEKKTVYKAYRIRDKAKLQRYSLCDAMRYLRAYEVGRPPLSTCYELAVKIQTNKTGAVLRDRIRLPYPTSSDFRIAVVCKEGSKIATDARIDGAVAVGEESLFAAIKAGEINFNRLVCHIDSVPELMKAGLGPILGPKGLMPSAKTKTIASDVRAVMRDIAGTDNYKEHVGVVRMAIGMLSFSPQMLGDNIKVFMDQLKAEMRSVSHTSAKVIDEVVLSTTNGPGFSLNGNFNPTDESVTVAKLSSVM
ncbi:hypothetical protein Sste5346_006652 [Sporothrix stenoceras]|uniref:Large subunit ribosomal protein L1 n=1 Tax=Sporothrix stenoceras TaxID=5173 RepID=A0ABR3YYH7_9PEZI